MIPYSQKNPKWRDLTIGNTKLIMGKEGCFITAIASLDGREPDVVLGVLNANNAFNLEGALLSNIAAESLGLDYNGKTIKKQKSMCIAETNFYRKVGFPQHFFVYLGDGRIMDPLDAQVKDNPYPIVSYRLFSKRPISPVIVKAPIKIEKNKTLFGSLIGWFNGLFRVLV